MEEPVTIPKEEKFPGEVGNVFDTILRKTAELQKIPAPILVTILIALALLVRGGYWPYAVVLWGFSMLDWLLLAFLPIAGRSYGPDRPIVVILALMRAPFGLLPPTAALIFQVIGTILVIYGFWIEPHRLTVTRQQLVTDKLPGQAHFTMLHLGDLHMERMTGREKTLNRLIRDLKPDLILFSGDFLNLSYLKDQTAWEHCRAVVREWNAPLGVFVVTGSPAVDLEHVVPTLLDGLPVRWLQDEMITLTVPGGEINLAGMRCTHKPFIDGPRLESIVGKLQERFSIFLYHTPDLAPIASQVGMDLQLSGHTHGGQVRIPGYGALFAASLYGKRFESGRYQVGDLTLYVTRGIGLEGQGAPRVRLFCPPEIIMWDISGQI